MARLAIRATGDKSRREHVTTADDKATIYVEHNGKHVATVEFTRLAHVVQMSVLKHEQKTREFIQIWHEPYKTDARRK